MLKPVEMCKVNILVLRRHIAAVTQLLGAREVLHLVDATAQSPGRLLSSFETADAQRLHQLSDKCAALIRQLDITGGKDAAADMSVDEITERLEAVSRPFEENSKAITALLTEVNRLKQQEDEEPEEPKTDNAEDQAKKDSALEEMHGRLAAT